MSDLQHWKVNFYRFNDAAAAGGGTAEYVHHTADWSITIQSAYSGGWLFDVTTKTNSNIQRLKAQLRNAGISYESSDGFPGLSNFIFCNARITIGSERERNAVWTALDSIILNVEEVKQDAHVFLNFMPGDDENDTVDESTLDLSFSQRSYK